MRSLMFCDFLNPDAVSLLSFPFLALLDSVDGLLLTRPFAERVIMFECRLPRQPWPLDNYLVT